MEIKCFNGYGNSYVIINDNQAVIIDTGMDESEVLEYLDKNNIQPKYLLLTHGHYDHCFKAHKYQQMGVKIYMSQKENTMMNLFWHIPPHLKDDFRMFDFENIEDDQTLNLIGLKFKTMFTPGHTAGGFCYILNDEFMFTGDTLFFGTVGATNYPMGDTPKLAATLKKLFSLEKDYKIFPGHGKSTTLFYEKKHNRIALDMMENA